MGNEADDEFDRAGEDEQPADEPQQPAAHSNGDGPSAEYDYVDPAEEIDEPVLADSGADEGRPPEGGQPPDEAAPTGEAGPLDEIGSRDRRKWIVIPFDVRY